ncbi:hypothetical protein [Sedimentibacter sp.]|uniref:hypothetical protein n=1 Tax=Sedimentibacter sp. TaxID=1960295 RepID=UPI00289791B8|nr:hypothetical protein [Sedimentibacter sp.]
MNHYDYVEWLLYKNKAMSNKKMKEMEEHLYNCQACLDIFLSLINEQEENYAGDIVPSDFTPKVLENITKSKIIKLNTHRVNKVKKSINYQLGYYAAVASVTIFLTLSGFYTNLVDSVPKITASIQEVQVRQNLIANLSDRIIDSTSSLLFSIENNEKNMIEEE